jgi:protein TonB
MKKLLVGVLLSSCSMLRADFTYQETAQVTGGMVPALVPSMPGLFEPRVSTHLIKGNRMATISKDQVTVIDLDKESIITINNDKKTYSVMTFAETKQAVEDFARSLSERIENLSPSEREKYAKDEDVQTRFKVNVKAAARRRVPPPGRPRFQRVQAKTVRGLNAREMIVTMTMRGTNARTGESREVTIVADLWVASVPGYDEVRAFQSKMAEKTGYIYGSGRQQMPSAGVAGLAGQNLGLAELAKELSKIDGAPIETIKKMGDITTPAASETLAAQLQPQQQKQQEAVVLEVTTTTLTSFSSNPVDSSTFEVPVGYTQVNAKQNRIPTTTVQTAKASLDSPVVRDWKEMATILVEKTEPVYPALAQSARIQGTVRFRALIDREGRVSDLQLVSGHPILVAAATDAAKKWRFAPTLQNGTPVEVNTTVEVKFNLQ